MMCAFCRHDETKVIDTRMSDSFVIRRRRECLKCRRRFTTHERVEESPMKVIKKDGSRVPYNREKLRVGLEKACFKRPISAEQIDELVRDVESDLNDNFEREVPSRYIGEKVFNRLRALDHVAFVRFASVYREFQDVRDFMQQVDNILRERKK